MDLNTGLRNVPLGWVKIVKKVSARGDTSSVLGLLVFFVIQIHTVCFELHQNQAKMKMYVGSCRQCQQ